MEQFSLVLWTGGWIVVLVQQDHLLGRSIAISQVEMKSDRMQQNAAGPTTRIVDFYKLGVVDVNKEISMISDDSVEECPFSETSSSGAFNCYC